MLGNVVQFVPSAIQPKRFVIFAIGLLACSFMSAVRGEENVKQVASKTDVVEKPPVAEDHPLYKLLEIAYKARAAVDKVDDYQCEFSKTEALKNKIVKTRMEMKFREEPFSVYLKFLDPKGGKDPNAGREVIYVKGANENKLLVHEAGLMSSLGTFKLVPTGPDAMADNKYPITQIGMKNMLNTLIKLWEEEGKKDGIKTQYRTATMDKDEVYTVYEAIHEPNRNFKFFTTRLYIDDATGLAIGLQQLAFPRSDKEKPIIVEEYFYRKLKTNVKLTNMDFDPKNTKYAFK